MGISTVTSGFDIQSQVYPRELRYPVFLGACFSLTLSYGAYWHRLDIYFHISPSFPIRWRTNIAISKVTLGFNIKFEGSPRAVLFSVFQDACCSSIISHVAYSFCIYICFQNTPPFSFRRWVDFVIAQLTSGFEIKLEASPRGILFSVCLCAFFSQFRLTARIHSTSIYCRRLLHPLCSDMEHTLAFTQWHKDLIFKWKLISLKFYVQSLWIHAVIHCCSTAQILVPSIFFAHYSNLSFPMATRYGCVPTVASRFYIQS